MNYKTNLDVILVGAGIMSGTLATLLQELDPNINIKIFEKLDRGGEESSNEWNNAGTGHSALCELNYTKEKEDGSIDISQAIKINEQFHISKQFWSYLVTNGIIEQPKNFITSLPHISFVNNKKDVQFLKKRYKALSENPLFESMEFTENLKELKEWMPLIMKERNLTDPIAATKMKNGTDINFGFLTRALLSSNDIRYNHIVDDFKKINNKKWEVKVRNLKENTIEYHKADFVFIGAGGGSLPLLQKTGIEESKKIGGFPISGIFLSCKKPDIKMLHNSKVYGKAADGAPPMSVPHLDTRYVNGKKYLLFGPFAGFSPKFLKKGSNLDLINSFKLNNLTTLAAAGSKNIPLVKYLISQVILSKDEYIDELRKFIPVAKNEDWEIIMAGQRVQIIKDTYKSGKGTLQFGTEVISASDGSIAALLGASPGASTAVDIMLNLIKQCFPKRLKDWEPILKKIIPSYGKSLLENNLLFHTVQTETNRILKL